MCRVQTYAEMHHVADNTRVTAVGPVALCGTQITVGGQAHLETLYQLQGCEQEQEAAVDHITEGEAFGLGHAIDVQTY